MDVGQSLRVSWRWVSVVPTAGCNGPCLVNKQRAVKSGRQRLMPGQSNWSSGLIEPQHGSVSSALSAIVVHRFLSPRPPPPPTSALCPSPATGSTPPLDISASTSSSFQFRSCVKVQVAVLSPRPNEPYGFCGRKATLNHASALVTICP